MASEAPWAVISSAAWAEYIHFSARASRRFGWTWASELLRLAGLDRAADNRARPAVLVYVPDALVETAASLRCGFRRAGPSGSRGRDVPANASTSVVDQWDRLRALACAIS